jgi:hypothetical protein
VRTLLLALVLVVGCNTRTIELDPMFLPLKKVVRADFVAPGMVSTITPFVFTRSVDDLIEAYAPGSVEWDALFFHERVHALREQNNRAYLSQYAVDLGFRWQEEQLGYAEEIQYRLAHGASVNPGAYALVLSSDYGGMVSYDSALAWIQGLLPP